MRPAGLLHAWLANGDQVTLESNLTSFLVWDAVHANSIQADNAVPVACGIHSDWTSVLCWDASQCHDLYRSEDNIWADIDVFDGLACALTPLGTSHVGI